MPFQEASHTPSFGGLGLRGYYTCGCQSFESPQHDFPAKLAFFINIQGGVPQEVHNSLAPDNTG